MSRWDLVQELFEETAELAPAERARVLDERTRGNAELIRAIEALVAADAAPLDVFERSATDLLRELQDEPPAHELCGEAFGSFRIEEHLSTGGMGHVYRATRSSAGTERRVALKVLRPGLDAELFLERFHRERATLASLEHENIVTFLDAGALPDGRPYLVMELVEGVPLTEWGRGVGLRERLAKFLRVLAAVQYAHQKLIVHRDLKPSNVLVTAKGVPKVLDFGVAAALEAKGGPSGHAPLTPAYASPEELSGAPTTTASDVYSLGVILRELTDEAPGDLTAIVEKALAPEADRYLSVDQMAGDLRRYLAFEPVSARSTTWFRRASLFARRHRGPLAVTAAILLALALGWVGSDLERRAARRDAGMGWRAHAQARLTARIFEGWIASVSSEDPELAADTARHLESVLTDELSEWPEAETLVRLTLADLYLARGEPELAAPHASRAHELSQVTRGLGWSDRERVAEMLRATHVIAASSDGTPAKE